MNATDDDAVDAFKDAHGGLPKTRIQVRRIPLASVATEPNPWAVPCPSCGAPAHVDCRGLAPNAVHPWRLVDSMAEGFRWPVAS